MSTTIAEISSSTSSGHASPIPTPWANQANTIAPAGAGGDDSQLVSGINIFWIVFVLGIASAWHPLGSSIGFPNKTRRYIRIFPLMAIFDTLLLYGEFTIGVFEKKQLYGIPRAKWRCDDFTILFQTWRALWVVAITTGLRL